MTGEQRDLFDILNVSEADAMFHEWVHSATGREVSNKFIRLAIGLKRSGFKSFGAKAIVERIRWHMMVKAGPDGDGFKINNSMTSRLSRFAEERAPELEGFFRKRQLRS